MIPFQSLVLFGFALFLLVVLMRTIKIVPQKQVKIIERLGKFHRTAEAGLNTIVPFLDSVRATIDLREQITKIEPQPVITRDNVTMEVDAVIYYLIADTIVDANFAILDKLSDALDEIEDEVLNRHRQEHLGQIFMLKRVLVSMRRVLSPQRIVQLAHEHV